MRLAARVAGAPISWGVCEVPGWGLMLSPDRVLTEMRQLGIAATELGPVGYLGDDPGEVGALLKRAGLRLVGGFVPVVLHDLAARADMLSFARQAARTLSLAGAGVFVTAVVVDPGWSPRIPLSSAEWRTLAAGLEVLDALCTDHDLIQVLHPHVGTLVETAADVERVLESSGCSWCLDTGHLTVGGVDPAAFAAQNASRVAHVHLKDVRLEIAAEVREGRLSLLEGTRHGLFQPLGRGDVDIAGVVRSLEAAGYEGWYVLEQDCTLDVEPALGSGPIDEVRRSLDFLEALPELEPAAPALPNAHPATSRVNSHLERRGVTGGSE
jgi:inosose dehydratase